MCVRVSVIEREFENECRERVSVRVSVGEKERVIEIFIALSLEFFIYNNNN